MSIYAKRFKYLLEQDDVPMTADKINDDSESSALDKTLGADGPSGDELGSKGVGGGIRAKYMSKLTDMISKFEEFAKYLNSDEEDSVNKFLNAVDKDGSIFAGVSRETGKVTTVAESLAALAEAMKGYVLTGQRKLRDQESAMSEF